MKTTPTAECLNRDARRGRGHRARRSAALLLAAFLPTAAVSAEEATITGLQTHPTEPDWTFSVTPYIWLPAMSGDIKIEGRPLSVDASFSDLVKETDLLFSLAAEMEAWYQQRWGVALNGLWDVLEVNNLLDGTPLRFDSKTNLGLFEMLGLYNLGEWSIVSKGDGLSWSLQPLAGVRVTVIKSEIDFENFGQLDSQTTFVDPILGARSITRFGEDMRWSWILRGDLGGFGVGSTFTWNAAGMLGYDFKIRGVDSTFILGARALYQDYATGSGSNRFKWDVTQYGPLLGLALKF